MEQSIQGTLGAGSTVVYTCPPEKTTKVVSIKFNNAAGYVLSLTRYDAILASTVTVYSFTLSAGDSVIDNNLYFLKAGDYLTVTTSVGATDYLIYLVEYP